MIAMSCQPFLLLRRSLESFLVLPSVLGRSGGLVDNAFDLRLDDLGTDIIGQTMDHSKNNPLAY